jgi:hypothetical protein
MISSRYLMFTLVIFAAFSLAPARAVGPTVSEPALRQELLDMYAADQQARVALMEKLGKTGFNFETANSIRDPQVLLLMLIDGVKTTWQDGFHQARLKAIIDRHGWPGKSLVGEDGARSAWLLVQHADGDLAFQERCLSLMREAPAGEVSPQNIAYLTDRVLVNEGCQQCYGTQLGEDFSPRPIYDRSTVDLRREAVGLPPLAEYVEAARAGYEELLKRE